jgi:hypothetical protein
MSIEHKKNRSDIFVQGILTAVEVTVDNGRQSFGSHTWKSHYRAEITDNDGLIWHRTSEVA